MNEKSAVSKRLIDFKLHIIMLVAAAFAAGYLMQADTAAPEPTDASHTGHVEPDPEPRIWTCSMHPSVQRTEPGLCPLCNMDLIPVEPAPVAETSRRTFETTEEARALMNIQTAPVERRYVEADLRLVGKIEIDETRLRDITAWVPGRIDKLYVDYTGVQVNEGDHLVQLYSPDLIAGQDELRRAAETAERLSGGSSETLRDSVTATLEASRAKLRRWGLTAAQVREAERGGATSDHVTIYSPIGGTVIHRGGLEGMYVETGTHIYTIADLSQVWVKLDAYESDLAQLHYGQKVVFTTEAYPGETFEGIVSFLDPLLNKDTRTVKVRVNVPNLEGKLRPEMFVRARIRTSLASEGRAMETAMAGKWVGPMHPEVVRDAPGKCDICGMDLIPAEQLGYASGRDAEHDMPLVIPASAPLLTGTRAIVYVEVPDRARPTFEGREVVLGSRANDYYVVNSGLREGELVVTNGNFKIDSALQIRAQPSMMSPDGNQGAGAHDHAHGGAND